VHEDRLVCTSRVLECVRQDRQTVKCAVLVDSASDGNDCRGEPRGVECRWTVRVTEDAADQSALDRFAFLLGESTGVFDGACQTFHGVVGESVVPTKQSTMPVDLGVRSTDRLASRQELGPRRLPVGETLNHVDDSCDPRIGREREPNACGGQQAKSSWILLHPVVVEQLARVRTDPPLVLGHERLLAKLPCFQFPHQVAV
jgi:hypothetical protein